MVKYMAGQKLPRFLVTSDNRYYVKHSEPGLNSIYGRLATTETLCSSAVYIPLREKLMAAVESTMTGLPISK